MKKIIFTATIVAIMGATFISCEKESTPNLKTLNGISIRQFQDLEELLSEISLIGSMDYDDLIAYEQQLNFNSYGKLAYQAIEEITAACGYAMIPAVKVEFCNN